MACQRVQLFTVAGRLADAVWLDVVRWSDARVAGAAHEWAANDWPKSVRQDVDAFVTTLTSAGYVPPVLYRSEHVDLWSMGDVFQIALLKQHADYCRRLLTESHEIIATRVLCSEQITPDLDAPDETIWLYTRINEAIAAWSTFAEHRLVLLVRTVLGGLWTDEEVVKSLDGIPNWWTMTGAG